MKKRVGIFGGSFDPVHQGHIHIVSSFLKSGLLDEVLITLTPDPPHKKKSTQAAYSHRLKMLELAFEENRSVVVSDIEQSLPSPSFTLQTIQHLKKTNQNTLYFLCMGEDSLANFHTWYKYRLILGEVTLIVARRQGYESDDLLPEILEKTIFINNTEVEVSSTEIRSGVLKNKLLPDKIADYIKKNQLYNV